MIVATAILGPDGLIHTLPAPARHGDIIHKMADQGMGPPPPDAQGFLTDAGRFLGRIVALGMCAVRILSKNDESGRGY